MKGDKVGYSLLKDRGENMNLQGGGNSSDRVWELDQDKGVLMPLPSSTRKGTVMG